MKTNTSSGVQRLLMVALITVLMVLSACQLASLKEQERASEYQKNDVHTLKSDEDEDQISGQTENLVETTENLESWKEETSKKKSETEWVQPEPLQNQEVINTEQKSVEIVVTYPPTVYISTKYAILDNTPLSWWYRMPDTLYQDEWPTIDDYPKELLTQYNGLWQMPLSEEKTVYLTFDASYAEDANTSQILDVANEQGIGLTFFVTGQFLEANPTLVNRMVKEGHTVGNHSYYHLDQPEILADSIYQVQDDIWALEDLFTSVTNQTITPYLRPPEGDYSKRSLAVITDMGYQPVFWSISYPDWDTTSQPVPEEAMDIILGQLHDGSILLLHTESATTLEILPDLIREISNRGYQMSALPK